MATGIVENVVERKVVEEDPFKLYKVPVDEPGLVVDERDKGTPDEWLKRNESLIRLTGLHPFNCEPPLPTLMDRGFITPPNLHYVRNHGPVPKLSWDTHTIELENMEGKVMHSMKMDELLQFDRRTLPVTLTCAGNRRKEQNMIKKSVGFSWGCGAVSTNIWSGVRLSDVLFHYGILNENNIDKVKYICFEGSEDLKEGKYGTSLAIETVLDPGRDVILAFEQNGEKLQPDHGYPVRMIIPGFIGGRMVKWLKRIWASTVESNNYYHYFDNRVLPPQVDESKANEEGWWYKPEYIINDRNINSAIASPAHNETLNLGEAGKTKMINGYAYNGGGRKISRVEVSFDSGESWELCKVTTTEKPTPYGKYWCWVFWEYEVDTTRLIMCKEIAVRAWDESTNCQPGNLTWNVMGMMNNPWFRVKIQAERTFNGLALVFKHPATIEAGGWMDKDKPKPADNKIDMGSGGKKITMEEVKRHKTDKDCWIVLDDRVYDCTNWLKDHPGGPTSIVMNGGTDATEFFNAIHSEKARAMLKDWYIGDLAKAGL